MQDPTPSPDFDLPTVAGARTAVSDSNDAATIADAATLTTSTAAKTPIKITTFFAPGTLLGARYQILKLLGQGGMGAVYQARDQELDRIIALKVIRPDLAADPSILQRFKQELILSRHVTHKNVVRIFDLGEAGGTKFITMEYVEGEDLRTVLRRKGKFSAKEAVPVIQQICR